MCAARTHTGKSLAARAGVTCARGALNALYRLCRCASRRDEALLFSRQTNTPSRDFQTLASQFSERGLDAVIMTKKLSARSLPQYIPFIVREVYHLARCRVCVIDRYDPVVSLLGLPCEQLTCTERRAHGLPVFAEFPTEPLVVQVWHAFGAFKKFGYQSLDTPEGHPKETARTFRIHRNCSWVVCSGEEMRPMFADAFNIPLERVVALPRPEYFELKTLAEKPTDTKTGPAEQPTAQDAGSSAAGESKPLTCQTSRKPHVLFAPTLRKSAQSPHPLRTLHSTGSWKGLSDNLQVDWYFHPLEETGLAAIDVSESLVKTDYVVTDYSSIVYEAYLLGKRVLFYVPDLESYQASPGINVDLQALCPGLCFGEYETLASALVDFAEGRKAYPQDQLDALAGQAFDNVERKPTCIVDFVCDHLR